MNNKKYINAYLEIINQFNETNQKWIKYKNYKGIEIYVDRKHVLNRVNNSNRSNEALKSYYNIARIKFIVEKFLKDNSSNLYRLIYKRNPQSFFFDISFKAVPELHIYFVGQLQFNEIKKCFQFCVSTFLPNMKSGEPYIPSPTPRDEIVKIEF